MLDWLIIGGGVHGTHLSLHLTRVRRVPRDRLRVLDPHAEPLARWDACARNAGMGFLRSPYVHHIDIPSDSLLHFTDRGEGKALKSFIDPFFRPSTRLFAAHARHVIRKNQLDELRVAGRAGALSAIEGGYRVETENGSIETRKVLFALSASEMPLWPDWARALRDSGAPIDHVFDPRFERERVPAFRSAVVVGGGITGAQLAMALAARNPGNVTLLTPHTPRVHRFDSDPGWMGPRYLERFRSEPDMARRRASICAARHKGSMPAEVRGTLRRAAQLGKLAIRVGSVRQAVSSADTISLGCDDGTTLEADRVVLTTGFETRRPGGEWLDRAIADMGLPVAPCGYPIVDPSLCWHPGLYTTGALAELELGPVARNIIGARHAAERLKA
jgi:glycine/D-amino acid oxidase-like deaminating enzyme